MAMDRWQPRRSIMAWQPFRAMEQFEKEFEDIFSRAVWPTWKGAGTDGEATVPKLDIFEKEDKFVIKAELPGMKGEDIDISVTGDMLTIRGEKKTESEVKEEDYYRRETSYGSFARSIRLPSSVNIDKITASSEDGILEIDLPKSGVAGPKKISMAVKKTANAEPKSKTVEAKPKAAKPRAKKGTASEQSLGGNPNI